jgi:hypothetical protein
VCAGPRFDGVFGFSQGAALAGLLAAVQESGNAPPEFHFGFALMVGGFTSDLPKHAELFPHKLTSPSVHVIGRRDVIVSRKDSLRLADRFADRWSSNIPTVTPSPATTRSSNPSPASSLVGKELTVNRDADAESGASPVMDLVPTPVGTAGLTWYPAHGSARASPCSGTVRPPGSNAPTSRRSPPPCPGRG